jgi:hypothetical protein
MSQWGPDMDGLFENSPSNVIQLWARASTATSFWGSRKGGGGEDFGDFLELWHMDNVGLHFYW